MIKKIVITGGLGFIGTKLIEKIKENLSHIKTLNEKA